MRASAVALTSVLVAVAAAGPVWVKAAERDAAPRIVFELTSGDPGAWESLLNNVENVQKALQPTSIEVVAHGNGLDMLRSDTSAPIRARMEQSAAGGVTFAACENTMRRHDVARDELVPSATTVDSGVAQVVRRQQQGWSYVRSGA